MTYNVFGGMLNLAVYIYQAGLTTLPGGHQHFIN